MDFEGEWKGPGGQRGGKRGWLTKLPAWLPGAGRFGRIGKRTEAQVGALVDAFAAFATLDDILSAAEADLILDMLRSAFPEVDHAWLTRRLRRAVKSPKPMHGLAAELRGTLDETGKLAVGLQLFTLVDAVHEQLDAVSLALFDFDEAVEVFFFVAFALLHCAIQHHVIDGVNIVVQRGCNLLHSEGR